MSTERYPTEEIDVDLGPFALRLLTVARLEQLVDATALLRDDEVAEPPYWAHLWTGSRVLAGLVATEIECAGRRAIDLGCGLGLAGITAARRGARVVLCDHVFEALRFARANARLNRCAVDLATIDLCRPGLRSSFDLCLAADVTYDPTLQTALADFFTCQLSERGEAWCVESVRTTDQGFADACRARALAVEEREVSAIDEGKKVAVRVTVVRREADRRQRLCV